jgi:hypothetical protein
MTQSNGLLPYIFKGYKGENLFGFTENVWGMTRIGDEIFVAPYNASTKIYVIQFGTFKLVRTLQLTTPLFGYGSLGTDGEKLYARINDTTPYMIKELDKNTGAVIGNLIQPKTNVNNTIASFYINKDWNLLFMPNYDGNVYCFDLATGNQLSSNSLPIYTTGITIVNKEYIAVSSYWTNTISVATIPNYETFTGVDFGSLKFEQINATIGSHIAGLCSFGEFLLYTSYTTNDIKWFNLKRLKGDNVHSERYLVYHDSRYKIFNPFTKVKNMSSLVPVLTSNTSNGVVSASSVNGASNEPFNVFNNNRATSWTTANGVVNGWLAYQFTTPTVVNAYSIEARESSVGETPRSWIFEGWDGGKWVLLDKRNGETNWQKNEMRVFTFKNSIAYIKYRITIFENNGYSNYTTIQNMKMFNIADGMGGWLDYSTIAPLNLENIFIYGIKDLSKIREEDWDILASINPNIKIVRYMDSSLVDFAKNKSDLLVSHDTYKNVLNVKFTPLNQIAIPLDNIAINEDIERFDLGFDREYYDKIRLFVSFDNGITWEAFKKGNWISVDISNEVDVLQNGMKVWEFESLRTKNFKNKISFGFIKIGFMIETDILEKGVVDIDNITAYIYTYMNGADIGKMSFYILNTTSAINVTFIGNKLSGTLSDFDLGLVQYRVYLNGKPYYPSTGEFTPLKRSPEPIALNIKNKDVLMNQLNELRVDFQDYWGNTDSWTTHFIGTYAGLMFADPSGDYYTTDIGEILKYLKLGTMVAGQTSTENQITLINKYGHAVKDLEVRAANELLPWGVKVELSKTQYPFTAEEKLTWNTTLNHGQSVVFWLRLTTDVRANSIPNGRLQVRARATKV